VLDDKLEAAKVAGDYLIDTKVLLPVGDFWDLAWLFMIRMIIQLAWSIVILC